MDILRIRVKKHEFLVFEAEKKRVCMGISITESDDSDSLFLNFSENGSKRLEGILIRTKKSQYLNKVEPKI